MWLFIFVSLISGAAFAGEDLSCGKGRLRILENGKSRIEYSTFCTNDDGTVLISEKFKKKKVIGKKVPKSESLNPGFVFCRKLGATPELVDIEVKGRWYELDRCLFDDGSFIDTGSLYELGDSSEN